jgi:hypothetical protein
VRALELDFTVSQLDSSGRSIGGGSNDSEAEQETDDDEAEDKQRHLRRWEATRVIDDWEDDDEV